MDAKKLLLTGLVASVVVASTEASQVCGDGGFYVGVNLGASFSKMKYKNSLDAQPDALTNQPSTEYTNTEVANTIYYDVALLNKTSLEATSFSKRKTMFVGDIEAGYDFRINDVMLGVGVKFGKGFGKIKKSVTGGNFAKYQSASAVTGEAKRSSGTWNPGTPAGANVITTTEWDGYNKYIEDEVVDFKLKNKFYVDIMPRVGYLITPAVEVFATAGVKFTSDKLTFTYNNGNDSASKTKTKCVPVVGAGVMYNFTPNVYTKLEYNYNFKAKLKKSIGEGDNEVSHKVDHKSQSIKVGVGYRF